MTRLQCYFLLSITLGSCLIFDTHPSGLNEQVGFFWGGIFEGKYGIWGNNPQRWDGFRHQISRSLNAVIKKMNCDADGVGCLKGLVEAQCRIHTEIAVWKISLIDSLGRLLFPVVISLDFSSMSVSFQLYSFLPVRNTEKDAYSLHRVWRLIRPH